MFYNSLEASWNGVCVLRESWPLKRGSIHMELSMTGQKKWWPFNTGDCLIRVIA
jgi:hypothetical protein